MNESIQIKPGAVSIACEGSAGLVLNFLAESSRTNLRTSSYHVRLVKSASQYWVSKGEVGEDIVAPVGDLTRESVSSQSVVVHYRILLRRKALVKGHSVVRKLEIGQPKRVLGEADVGHVVGGAGDGAVEVEVPAVGGDIPVGEVVLPGQRNVHPKVHIPGNGVGSVEVVELDGHRHRLGGVPLVGDHLEEGRDRGAIAVLHDLRALQDLAKVAVGDLGWEGGEGQRLRMPGHPVVLAGLVLRGRGRVGVAVAGVGVRAVVVHGGGGRGKAGGQVRGRLAADGAGQEA